MSGHISDGNVWKPRLQILLGAGGINDLNTPADTHVPTALTCKVLKNNWFQADKHKCTFALFGDPQFGYKFWTNFTSISITVNIMFEGVTEWTKVFSGFVDKLTIDCGKGVVTLEGRNILGLLVDRQLVHAVEGHSLQQVLEDAFAEAHPNMPKPQFDLPFPKDDPYSARNYPAPGGKEADTGNSQGNQSTISITDLMNNICQQVGGGYRDVDGVIHFYMNPTDGNANSAYVLTGPHPDYQGDGMPSGNVTKLGPSNSTTLTIEHDIALTQWQTTMQTVGYDANGKGFVKTATVGEGVPRVLSQTTANKKQENADTLGQHTLKEMLMHEWIVTWKQSGPELLNIQLDDTFELRGIDPVVDGWFQIDSIEHDITWQKGYNCTVKGRWGRT